MENKQEYVIGYYQFASKESYEKALNEIDKINKVKEKLNIENLDAVALVYVNSIQNQVFDTLIGIDFLKELRAILEDNNYTKIDLSLQNIPVITNVDAMIQKGAGSNIALRASNNELTKQCDVIKQKNRTLQMMLFVMILVVLSLFAITFYSKNPNIINYERALVNKYSNWETELKERENVIKEKELELELGE